MKKAIFTAFLTVFGFSAGLSVINTEFASAAGCQSDGVQLFSIPAWYRGLTGSNCEIKKITQDGSGIKIEQFVWTIIGNIMDAIFRIIGVVAIGFIMWAGFQYMISTGDTGRMAAAKTTIVNAVTGLVIALVASAVVQFVMGVF